MRWNAFVISISAAAMLTCAPAPSAAASLGTVVPIGGHASDIALDESRGVLYVANFTANRIEVMSTASNAIRTSMNVAAQPAALAISPDNQFLLVAHYGNVQPADPSKNAITLINLNDNTRQTFATGDTPLAVTFVSSNGDPNNYQALIQTTSGIALFDPISGAMDVKLTFGTIGKTLPTQLDTFPAQVILGAVTSTPDHTVAYGVADAGQAQAFYRYDHGRVAVIGIVASPKPLPRVGVSDDGSYAMIGMYRIDPLFRDTAQFPNAISTTNVGGVAIDSKTNTMYTQILTASPASSSSATPAPSQAATASPAAPPVLTILDADNLTVRETLSIAENITGRSVLSSGSDMLYAVSDSGVLALPVGRLKQYHRLTASATDIVVRGNFCNRSVISQSLTITDPGGGNTDFVVSSNTPGVTIAPAAGVTPATVQVRVDPAAFQNQSGTVAVSLTISSATAVNIPTPVRLLINNRNPDQRGTFVDVPGTLTDIVSDPRRNRFYVVQQDRNQVLVFDGATQTQIAALRTSTTPTQLAMTFDRQYLIVGHDNSQFAFVYDLDTLQPDTPIEFPGGHYPRSIAESGKSMLALVRNVAAGGPGVIDVIDMQSRRASQLPALGIYTNSVNPGGVLAPSANGGSILVAMPDGNVMLYDANADTFTLSRKDFSELKGAYAASSYNSYVVGNNVLNASLVPAGTLETSSGSASGFTFVDQWGFRTTTSSASNPGVIQRVDPQSTAKPTRMVEAPLLPSTAMPLMRTLAALYDRSAVVSLTVSGFTVLPWNYDAAVAPPKIDAVVNAADGKQPVAPGGLISIYGNQMSPVNMATKEIPLPTALGESCLTVNGIPVPMLFVSSTQINGQLPFNVDGNATMTIRTPGGVSDNFYFSIYPAAPSIFRSGSAGPETGLATVTRAANNQLVTVSNPIHPKDVITIYATGLGWTSPPVDTGLPAPSDPLPAAVIAPEVTLGGAALDVQYAGLAPGYVGVYQINASVPFNVPQGMDIPLQILQGGISTTLSVRVVK
ncbi:MAG TPA: hypothetical protein VGF59_18695 [Bryobacteraceae bacterium]